MELATHLYEQGHWCLFAETLLAVLVLHNMSIRLVAYRKEWFNHACGKTEKEMIQNTFFRTKRDMGKLHLQGISESLASFWISISLGCWFATFSSFHPTLHSLFSMPTSMNRTNGSPKPPSPHTTQSWEDDEYAQIIEGVKKIYKSRIRPLEVTYNFEGAFTLLYI